MEAAFYCLYHIGESYATIQIPAGGLYERKDEECI